jgi:polysaccharide export outer membrane protein
LQIAGGITPKADIRQIQIRRLARSGSEKIINVDMWQLLQTGDISQDLILQEGDTIAVPKALAINPAEAIQIANASFSPDKINVSVVGEVAKPGVIEVPPNTPLNQAILAAGGFNERARTTVDLIHVNENGTVSKQVIAVNFSRGIDDRTNPILQRNDIIVVTPSDVAGAGDTLGLILNPLLRGLGFLNIFGIFR